MKLRHLFSTLFGILGCALAVLAVQLAFTMRGADPVLLKVPEDAESCIVNTMELICSGDYTGAEQYLYGKPDLGADRVPEDVVSAMVWQAFTDSLSYELADAYDAGQDGLSRTVRISCMDIGSVTANLRQRSMTLLQQWVEEAEDPSEVYDESNGYKQSLVMEALRQAAEAALAEDASQKTVELTVRLIFRDGQWWVVADEAFLNAISGGLAR